jgi:hypothetical protein
MLRAQKQFLVASFDAFDLHLKKPLIAGRAATAEKASFSASIPHFYAPWESRDSRINSGAHQKNKTLSSRYFRIIGVTA